MLAISFAAVLRHYEPRATRHFDAAIYAIITRFAIYRAA